MPDIKQQIESIDWPALTGALHESGYGIVPGFLRPEQCRDMIELFDTEQGYRKTVQMERYRFGAGTYKYWHYPLPELVQSLRENLYPNLAPIANEWAKRLNMEERFPDCFADLQTACRNSGQLKPTPLILRYETGGYNTLHQDLYGDVYFPLQAACFLSDPNKDYSGGEFILVEQIPRAQSKAIVLTPQQGDMIIFTTRFRPVKGVRGYYRATMKHGVSPLHRGQRYALGIIFHDAVT